MTTHPNLSWRGVFRALPVLVQVVAAVFAALVALLVVTAVAQHPWGIFTVVALVGAYFVPTIVAWRRHQNTAAVFALNLFLGWTFLGWVAALVMALWTQKSPVQPEG